MLNSFDYMYQDCLYVTSAFLMYVTFRTWHKQR